MKVVVLGGTGHFGARIVRGLAGDDAIDLVVAARDAMRARAFAQPLGAAAARLDVADVRLAEHLQALRADLVARWLHRGGALFDAFGTDTGGMVVRLRGRDGEGRAIARAWDLTAPGHHGPEIPSMPAILLARRLARGAAWAPGAGACMGLLSLEDFAPEFARWGMVTEVRGEP